MNQADVAWMLVATALVLLMTPALGFFYGGLVRSKNALNTMMMSVVRARLRRRGLGAPRLLARLRAGQRRSSAALAVRSCAGVGLEAQGTHPAPAVHGLPGHVRHHHRGAHLGRDRRAHALRRLPRSSSRSGRSSSTRRSRTGSGAAAGWPSWARSTSRAAPSCTSTPAWPRWSRRSCSGRARTTRGRRSCPTTCPSRCSARACSGSAGSASTRAARSPPTRSAALAFVNTMFAGADGDARGLDAARPAAHRQGHRGRRGHRRSSSAWSRSRPRPASSSPLSAIALGALAAFPSYYALLWRARTRLDDSLDVVAAHGLGGTVGALLTGVLAQKAWNGAADGLLFGNPRQLGDPGGRRAGRRGLQRRRHLRAAQARRRSSCRCGPQAREEGLGLDVSQHGEEAYARRRRRDPRAARRGGPGRPPPRHARAEGGRA